MDGKVRHASEWYETKERLEAEGGHYDSDGNPLAPNGKKSNLTAEQYITVRTPSFKRWFGDWEAAANWGWLGTALPVASLTGEEFGENLVDAVNDYYQGLGGSVTREDIGRVMLTRRGIQSSRAHGMGRLKAAAFKAVPTVIGEGRIFSRTDDYKGRGYEAVVIAAPVSIAGDEYICEVVLNRGKKGTSFYLHEVEVRNKLQPGPQVRTYMDGKSNAYDQAGASRLIVSKLDAEGKFESSKVVDENGEPLVVYHGTPRGGFSKFRGGTSSPRTPGFYAYFSDDFDVSSRGYTYSNAGREGLLYRYADTSLPSPLGEPPRGGSRVYEVFLNIRKPKVVDYYGFRWNGGVPRGRVALRYLGDDVGFREGHTYQAWDREERRWSRRFVIGRNGLVLFGDETAALEEARALGLKEGEYALAASDSISRQPYVLPSPDQELAEAKAEGRKYDGLICRNIQDGGGIIANDYIPFRRASQIKSATENIGTFDAKDGDIRFQDTEAPIYVPTAGDADSVLRQWQGKDIVNKSDGLTVRYNSEGRNKMLSRKALDKSMANGFTREQHNTAVANVRLLFENSVRYLSSLDRSGSKDVTILRYRVPVMFGGTMAETRMFVKETEREEGAQDRLYTVEIAEIAKPSQQGNGGDAHDVTKEGSVITLPTGYPDVNRGDLDSLYLDAMRRQELTNGDESLMEAAEGHTIVYTDEGGRLRFQRAWHGTGASFDRFSTRHIGEGEG